MAYYVNLFSPETWARFQDFGANISGFRERQKAVAQKLEPGDTFVCYLTGYSRWCGVLEVESAAYLDDQPLYSDPDPFVVRFRVRAAVALSPEYSLPISWEPMWSALSFTKNVEPGTSKWTGRVRSSLTRLDDADGEFLARRLEEQASTQKLFPISEEEARRVARKKHIPTLSGDVAVEVPELREELSPATSDSPQVELRESHAIQAILAELGSKMGFHIWIPASDRQKILDSVGEETQQVVLTRLPLNYNDTTLDTVANIDVLWLKGRSMARAFEVEHTTSIYSGLLRMADLLSLQPNMNIRLHIVAPDARRDKVIQEIRRPVFSLLSSGPLYGSCTFLSYDAVRELAEIPHVEHMKDEIIAEFEESAEL